MNGLDWGVVMGMGALGRVLRTGLDTVVSESGNNVRSWIAGRALRTGLDTVVGRSGNNTRLQMTPTL
ncbi:MAG: hypothetical protein KTR25_01260 [Myxococcales bacterium]|nr:hypothetical protein [Myxococcales bacterium]